MPAHMAADTQSYLQATRSVVFAGTQLLESLKAGALAREEAIAEMEAAALQQEAGGATQRAFMFESLAGGSATEQERAGEDTMASLLLEARVANVLLAAGVATGEEDAPPEGSEAALEAALHDLERDVGQLEGAFAAPPGAPEPGRFGFQEEGGVVLFGGDAGEAGAAPVVKSDTVEAALQVYEQTVAETLDNLVAAARDVVSSAVEALSRLDSQKVAQALSNLGLQAQALPSVGRLIRAGLRKLESVLDGLVRLVGTQLLGQAREKVERVWQDVKEGKHVDGVLARAFAVNEARDYALAVAQLQHATPDALDECSTKLKQAALKFREAMKLDGDLVTVITAAGGLLLLAPFAAPFAPQITLFMATAYGLVLAHMLLLGRDYTDADELWQRVPGVRQLADGARPA